VRLVWRGTQRSIPRSTARGSLKLSRDIWENQPVGAHTDAETKLESFEVNVRIKISALWTSVLFVLAYVDLFSLDRRDFRADLEAGEVSGFTINQSFLWGPPSTSSFPV
jgi:hypothetical protein